MSEKNIYPRIDGLRGNEGEDEASLVVVAILDPSPNYPDSGRIIVGAPRDSIDIGGFSCSPEVARLLAATLVQAANAADTAKAKP